MLFSRVDVARLWGIARTASWGWLAAALGLYLLMVVVSAWRWGLLLHAQHIVAHTTALVRSYLVATFFNNFLPSNIGGDVIRIRDTAGAAGSKTLAATVVLGVQRGFMGTLLTGKAQPKKPTGVPLSALCGRPKSLKRMAFQC